MSAAKRRMKNLKNGRGSGPLKETVARLAENMEERGPCRERSNGCHLLQRIGTAAAAAQRRKRERAIPPLHLITPGSCKRSPATHQDTTLAQQQPRGNANWLSPRTNVAHERRAHLPGKGEGRARSIHYRARSCIVVIRRTTTVERSPVDRELAIEKMLRGQIGEAENPTRRAEKTEQRTVGEVKTKIDF